MYCGWLLNTILKILWQIDVLYTITATINTKVQGFRVRNKKEEKREPEREREREKGGGGGGDVGCTYKSLHLCCSRRGGSPFLLSCRGISSKVGRPTRAGLHTNQEPVQGQSCVHLNIKLSHTKQVLQKERFMALSRTKSIKSERFFSMSCGGRRLMRSRAQSSCCSWLACNGVWRDVRRY